MCWYVYNTGTIFSDKIKSIHKMKILSFIKPFNSTITQRPKIVE